MIETFRDTRTLTATKEGIVIGVLDHPIILAKDWRTYLTSKDNVEEKKRKIARQKLESLNEPTSSDPKIRSFIETNKSKGCDVHVNVGSQLFPYK